MYSFDVFDTLITRCTAEPKGIFLLMGEKMREGSEYAPFFTENFYELRIGAEEWARAHTQGKGKQEVTLKDIYDVLETTSYLTKKQQENLMTLEVETECNSALGICSNINMLKSLKDKGERIVLISDMYLGGEQIRHILCKVDEVFRDIPIYVSSDLGRTKGRGGLYQIVKELENAEYSDWVHFGDNMASDVVAASKLGIKAVYCQPGKLMEYEVPGKSVFHQLSVGISKYIRWGEEGDTAGEVGGSLAGPIVYSYVRWVLTESVRRGINRLYFVARDGWILQQIADVVIRTKQYPIKTMYLYGSRKAWRLPSYEGTTKDIIWILKGALEEVDCLEELAGILQLDLKALRNFLPEDFQKTGGKEKISWLQREYICALLPENQAFREYLAESQADKKRLVIRYLQQEIDCSDDKFAFVELYGTGLTQKCLARLLGNFYTGDIRNFYFSFRGTQEKGQCSFLSFYPNYLERCYMIELLCRAPHGQTEGYRETGGRVLPVLEQTQKGEAYYLETYKNAVLAYTRHMEDACSRNGICAEFVMDMVKEYMGVIAARPPKRIAEYFCYMPYSSTGRKNGVIEFAPPISLKQIRKIYFWADVSNVREVYQGNSLDYALAISDRATRYKEKCEKYRKTKIGKWLTGWNRYLHTGLKPGIEYFCPWELLQGKVVIYGAGKVGQAYVKQSRQKHAKCDGLLWVDKDYERLQAEGFQVKSPEEIRECSFDRVIIAIHHTVIRQEIRNKLQEMGIEAGKIYYG